MGLSCGLSILRCLRAACCTAKLAAIRAVHPSWEKAKGGSFRRSNVRRPDMNEPFADGTIRKLWIGEADLYRAHLLRLDADSRHSRFGGGVSDAFVAEYVTLALGLD